MRYFLETRYEEGWCGRTSKKDAASEGCASGAPLPCRHGGFRTAFLPARYPLSRFATNPLL